MISVLANPSKERVMMTILPLEIDLDHFLNFFTIFFCIFLEMTVKVLNEILKVKILKKIEYLILVRTGMIP